MTRRVIESSARGAVVAYEETPEERAERVAAWADELAEQLDPTPGQKYTLLRVHVVAAAS